MSLSYPVPAAPATGDAALAHRILKSPPTVAQRVQDLSLRRYIADLLLSERLEAVGGAIVYESGEEVGTGEAPRAVAPGASYPLVSVGEGVANLAKTTKWGQDMPITDESIARRKMSPVNRAFTRLVNQNVMHVDSIAMSVITTAAGTSTPVSARWTDDATDAEQILKDVLRARARAQRRELGINLNVAALDPMVYAEVKAKFIAAGYVPREGGNPLSTGDEDFLNVENIVWTATPHGVPGAVVLADNELLGGMADEDLQSPGYARATGDAAGVEVKSIRDEDNDRYKVRARRVTVPVVLEPYAAEILTGADNA
ncbi:hypothetical protein [Serinicoccus sediminis]|uniref:phage major capsid protein n=1 Tax=Serinicoccus sediminis TaxID=2306021 RepID=UPI001EDE2BC4|nr:hypothetical protein [Serinicoccus sediminis]